MLGLGKSKELSRTENGEVNFQGWPSGEELFSPAVAVLFVLFCFGGGDRESHISSKRGQTSSGQETKSKDRW